MNCPGCGGVERSDKYVLDDYRVVRCASCRLLYNGDFPDASAVPDTFDEHYYRDVQAEAFAHVDGGRGVDASVPIYTAGLDVVEKRAGRGRLLDVGCAFGSFLAFARGRGWDVSGVEVSKYSSRIARSRGLDVHTGDLATYDAPAGTFDLVTLWDVIEHVREVQGTISRAARLLKPGGHLVLTTDNYRSLLSVLTEVAYRCSLGLVTYPVRCFYIPFNSCYLTRGDLLRMGSKAELREVFFMGMDYPIEKIKLSPPERVLLSALYGAGRVLRMNSQFLMVLQCSR